MSAATSEHPAYVSPSTKAVSQGGNQGYQVFSASAAMCKASPMGEQEHNVTTGRLAKRQAVESRRVGSNIMEGGCAALGAAYASAKNHVRK